MKTFVRICRSIIRKNKGFTAGIFIMSVLSVSIAFLGGNFGASSSDTIMGFISESGMPDAVYVTDVMSEELCKTLENIEGVRFVSPRFLYDTNIETADGSIYSVRVLRWDPDAPFSHTIHEEIRNESGNPGAAVSSEFAEYNNIHPGDQLRVDTPFGKKMLTVDAVVSNPETMNCVKDEMSAYESYQFAYLYIRSGEFNEILPTDGQANQWLIYFEDDLPVSEQKEHMEEIRSILGKHMISESLTEESDALTTIRDDLHTISVLCSFIPGIIWLISLGFNFIFIKIIVENQRKTIGLLRALGFSIRKVVLIFITYTVLINLPALLCGVVIGSKLLRACLGLIAAAEGILDVTVTISPGITVIMLLIVFVIGIAAALMSAGAISKIDPCEAYGGMEGASFEPPKCISTIRTDAFFKISIVSLIRNYKRQIVGALCIAACIISMCVGFEGVLTIGNPIDAVYGGRYRYDLTVRGIDQSAISRIENEVSGVAAAESATYFSSELFGNNVRICTIAEEDEMTVLFDAGGNRIFPKDGVILDEMCARIHNVSVGDFVTLNGKTLPVTGIAREILFTVLYISPQTAAELGYDEPNCVLLKLTESAEINDIEQQISEICNTAYFSEFASQKENIRSGFVPMRAIMLVFAILAFCIGSLLILNITIIDFNENRTRYATLRALGTPVKRMGVISVVQNLIRVLLGIVIACPLCYVCVSVLLQLLSGASQQYVMVKYTGCLILSCLISFLYVLFGTLISLAKIREMDFCSCLNEME